MKTKRLFWFAVFVFILLCALIVWAAIATEGTVSPRERTQTQNVIEATWDAEFHATLTAQAK